MITTYDHPVGFGPHRASTEWVPAVCANLHLRVPLDADTFQGVREPPDPRLVSILRSHDGIGASPTARQMAVWIMTDDAGWASLGTRFSGETRVRYVSEDDAARALRTLDQNGVAIASKAIWADAREILGGVENPDLKAWLETRV